MRNLQIIIITGTRIWAILQISISVYLMYHKSLFMFVSMLEREFYWLVNFF